MISFPAKIRFLTATMALGWLTAAPTAQAQDGHPPFELAQLRQAYRVARLPEHHRPGYGDHRRVTVALEDVGIKSLLEQDIEGLPTAERILMLNDYGYWLTEAGLADQAVAVLQRVLTLSPNRAVAHLNLGDAARLAVISAATYDEKVRLSRMAVQAYASYRKLTGKDAKAAKSFSAFNVANAPTSNVCDYVAAAYNKRQADLIFTDPKNADITNDGRRLPFEIRYEGTLYEGRIETFDADIALAYEPPSIDFIGIVPFRGIYYVVYEVGSAPVAVLQANAGTPCLFEAEFTPVISQGKQRPLCEQVRRGEQFPEAWKQLPLRRGDDSVPDDSDESSVDDFDDYGQGSRISFDELEKFIGEHLSREYSFGELQAESRVDLDHSGRGSIIGHIEYNGPTCRFTGVSFLDGSTAEATGRNANLIRAQNDTFSCHLGATMIVRVGNDPMIDIRGKTKGSRGDRTRALLRMQGDSLTTVCQVDYVPTYKPVGASTANRPR